MYLYVYISLYIYIYACVYMYIYMHTYIRKHTRTNTYPGVTIGKQWLQPCALYICQHLADTQELEPPDIQEQVEQARTVLHTYENTVQNRQK